MHGHVDPQLKPSKLSRRDLALTIPPELRNLPPHVIQEEMQRRRAMLERFDVHTPRFKQRLVHYVVGAMIFLPIFTWLFTPVGLRRLWLQLPLAAAFGAALAYTRAGHSVAVGLSLLYGMAIWFVVGGLPLSFTSPGLFLLLVVTCMFFVVLGWALGASEDLSRFDGR